MGSVDVNDYLRRASGGEFTAKDFRTWHGSAAALARFQALGAAGPTTASTSLANHVIAEVAQLLGNTVAVCRKSYIHPRILALLTAREGKPVRASAKPAARGISLTTGDCAFLAFLKHQK